MGSATTSYSVRLNTRHVSQPIDAAFPTTTPAGLATLTLAMEPGLHGFVGATFHLPDFDVVLNPLHWNDAPAPLAVQPERNAFGAFTSITSHGPAQYLQSGMTRVLLHDAEQRPYDAFDPRVITPRAGHVDYVYLPELDKVGHGEGPNTKAWERCLATIDSRVAAVCAQLPESAYVVVTSDHGMVYVPDSDRINVDSPLFQAGVRCMAGEPRMRHLYTDTPHEVVDRWSDLLGGAAQVMVRDDAIARGLFGAVDPMLRDRIGDVIAIAHATHAMTSAVVDPKPSGLRGLHGALTDEELLVPLLLLRGVA